MDIDLTQILERHAKWLAGDENGVRADLSDANLSRANLSDANLSDANLSRANLSDANLNDANLRGADLSDADLSDANLSRTNFYGANLSDANLSDANLSRANLSRTNLSRANLSRAIGLLSASEYLVSNFEKVADGVIVYKTFGLHYSSPDAWKIEPGETIAEVVNPCRTCDCACGINVGTRNWVEQSNTGRLIWKCLIRWEWLPDVVVPYNTNGKIRAGKVQLLEVVEC